MDRAASCCSAWTSGTAWTSCMPVLSLRRRSSVANSWGNNCSDGANAPLEFEKCSRLRSHIAIPSATRSGGNCLAYFPLLAWCNDFAHFSSRVVLHLDTSRACNFGNCPWVTVSKLCLVIKVPNYFIICWTSCMLWPTNPHAGCLMYYLSPLAPRSLGSPGKKRQRRRQC